MAPRPARHAPNCCSPEAGRWLSVRLVGEDQGAFSWRGRAGAAGAGGGRCAGLYNAYIISALLSSCGWEGRPARCRRLSAIIFPGRTKSCC